jgi:hypothetical protein
MLPLSGRIHVAPTIEILAYTLVHYMFYVQQNLAKDYKYQYMPSIPK